MQIKIVLVDNKGRELIEFTQEDLESMLEAGLSLRDIVKTLKQKTHGI